MISYQQSKIDISKLVPARPTDASDRWAPIPHYNLIQAIQNNALKLNWTLSNNKEWTSPNGQSLVATWDAQESSLINLPKLQPEGDFPVLSLGLLNLKEQSIRLAGGFRTTTHNVGLPLFILKVGLHDKGTLDNLEGRLCLIFRTLKKSYEEAEILYHKMTKKYLKKELANELILQAGRGVIQRHYGLRTECIQFGLMPWSRLGLVDNSYQKGEHKTAWNLYYQFCKTARLNPPLKQIQQCLGFLVKIKEVL